MAADDRFTEDFRDAREEEVIGTIAEVITGPVADWATDFSHVEPAWAADPYPIQDDLRQRCPIARTGRFGGAWLPTRYEDVAAIAYDTERFSSRSIIMGNFRPPRDIAPIGGSPPISSDPPFHQHARKLLLGAFTKTAISRQEPATRAFCHYLIGAEIFGQKLTADHVTGAMALLLIAGIDTTWSAIGSSLWHLARTPADRERLVAEPGLVPTAMEEFLRAYAPVTMARLVMEDMHWHGVDMKADDWILLSFPAASRDPAQFGRAGEVVIDREVNRHAAFGLGIHRCLGSHLARMELRVALEAWLSRIGEFTLDDPAAVTWPAGQIRGPRTLPLRLR